MKPLDWYRINSHRFPAVTAVARALLFCPGELLLLLRRIKITAHWLVGGSVAVERLFSAGRDFCPLRRTQFAWLMNYPTCLAKQSGLTPRSKASPSDVFIPCEASATFSCSGPYGVPEPNPYPAPYRIRTRIFPYRTRMSFGSMGTGTGTGTGPSPKEFDL